MAEVKIPVRVFYELTEDEANDVSNPPLEELEIVACDIDADALWVYVRRP